MKKILQLLLLLPFCIQAQNKVLFTYDTAGNQITRILCINCTSKKAKETITETELEKFFPEDVISYYPNPVKEELYLQWQLTQENYVSSISIYAITGQVLRTFQVASKTNCLNIPFQQYSSGVYLVLLSYKDGDEKTIKIIKK